MRVCGVEIKSNEAIICLMTLEQGLFQLPDCRQQRFVLQHDKDAEAMRKFQFSLQKFFQDYQVSQVVIKERPQKGKFAGGAIGFKIEAALQLLPAIEVTLVSSQQIKEQLSRNPLLIDFKATGLKGFQQTAFETAYSWLQRKE
ncbi:DUF3010 family protein [Alkalimonas delamerensis]|uniref:DUF3010 family protein n=1 Tax=Alkalimonas delamerensis TaxID=265981 RepID=A0ABT9GTB5_9GAMM|nr:DUF3010 family protein [Alkalimonas delamerensis]MDP4530020.1 DUF3010 family protein [Alkalimonas delamerensis]